MAGAAGQLPRNVGGLYVGNLGGSKGGFVARTLVLDAKLMYDVFGQMVGWELRIAKQENRDR